MSRRQKRGKLIFILVFLFLVFVFVYSGLQILESLVLSGGRTEDVEIVSKTITRDGVDYFPRQDIEILLLMGIDKFGPVEDSGSYNNDGEVDTAMVMIFDQKDKVIRILSLNRDTMVEMPVLGIGGKRAGTEEAQLALSHTYGSGLEDSCENTRETVSDLLYGISMDYYVAMNMDAISVLNDAVGGVTVDVTDDFSAIDTSIPMGEVTLHGEQAITFVRGRKDVGSELNVSRMERQREYINGFLTALDGKVHEDNTFVVQAYEDASPYIVTDCSVNVLSNMLDEYSDYKLEEIVIPEGENVIGEEYMEFYLDQEKMDETILRLFYAPKE